MKYPQVISEKPCPSSAQVQILVASWYWPKIHDSSQSIISDNAVPRRWRVMPKSGPWGASWLHGHRRPRDGRDCAQVGEPYQLRQAAECTQVSRLVDHQPVMSRGLGCKCLASVQSSHRVRWQWCNGNLGSKIPSIVMGYVCFVSVL